MMMNINRQQSVAIGGSLIALGVIAWLGLWWLIWPAALVAGAVIGYRQRRKIGRVEEAVQVGLWGLGLALIFLLDFWVGFLFLAGASVLIRGREAQIDDSVQRMLNRSYRSYPATSTSTALSTQHVPVMTQPHTTSAPSVTIEEPSTPSTGETRRL
jgi:hypothetical protein